MGYIFHGEDDVQELPGEKAWNHQTGWVNTRRFKAIHVSGYTNLLSTLAGLPASYLNFDIQPGGAFDEMIVQYGTTDLTTLWELLGNDVEEDLWQWPPLVAVYNTYNDATANGVTKDILDGLEASPRSVFVANDLDPVDSAKDTILRAFYQKKCRGIDAFSRGQHVLRRSIIVYPGSSTVPVYTNNNKQWSNSSLVSAYSVPAQFNLDSIGGYWLEKTPTVTQLANGNFQITQEWWNAISWDTDLYPVHS